MHRQARTECILFNAFVGGLRNWYRLMEGSDNDMSDASMMRYAGRFSRRVQFFCKKKNIPFVHFQTGERKHMEAEKLMPKDKSFIRVTDLGFVKGKTPVAEETIQKVYDTAEIIY